MQATKNFKKVDDKRNTREMIEERARLLFDKCKRNK